MFSPRTFFRFAQEFGVRSRRARFFILTTLSRVALAAHFSMREFARIGNHGRAALRVDGGVVKSAF